jgi:hypothetical protein
MKKLHLGQVHFEINTTQEIEIDTDCCGCVFRFSKEEITKLRDFLNDFIEGVNDVKES